MKQAWSIVIVAVLLLGVPMHGEAAAVPSPETRREQISFDVRPVRAYAVSPDTASLALVVEDDGFTRLVCVATDGAKGPVSLGTMPAGYASPRFSSDGGRLVYVSDAEDAKGDILMVGLKKAGSPVRLTDDSTEDASPSVAPDGTVYYQTRKPGAREPRLARVHPGGSPEIISSRAVHAPVVSPDGKHVAFVSMDDQGNGDIHLLALDDGSAHPLVADAENDRMPSWAPDGRTILFSRLTDNGSEVWSVDVQSGSLRQLTASGRDGLHPILRGDNLYLLAATTAAEGRGANVFRLPSSGDVHNAETPDGQLRLARMAEQAVPHDDFLAVLALRRVGDRFPDSPEAAKAYESLGILLERMGQHDAAVRAFSRVSGSGQAEAQARIAYLEALSRLKKESGSRSAGLSRELTRLHQQASKAPMAGDYLAALLLEEFGSGARDLRRAMSLARNVANGDSGSMTLRAQAALLHASLAVRLTGSSAVDAYVDVVRHFPETLVAEQAVNQALDAVERQSPESSRVEALTMMVERYGEELPLLAASAQNRAGDLLLEADETPGAKAAYAHVIEAFPDAGRPVAAARLALAELLYREGRYAKAVDLYENAMGNASEDGIYRLARKAYLEKTAAAGDQLLRTGEAAAARSLFADLIRYDNQYVPAHRGWIRASVALGHREETLARYRTMVQNSPNDPVALYSLGLTVSYADTKDAYQEARTFIRQAVAAGGSGTHYFLTLGFLEEALENIHGESGGLERALADYERAWFLARDESMDRANAALNLGNVNLSLGRPLTAYRFYLQRLEANRPFDSPDTELQFYRHLGMAAFRANEPARTIDVFQHALVLVRERTDPLAPSRAFGRLTEAVRAKALRPAAQDASRKEQAADLARRQSIIDRSLADVSRNVSAPPPSAEWTEYRHRVADLLDQEHELMLEAADMVAEPAAREDFLALHRAAIAALDEPVRLAEAEAELLNRLALALQDDQQYAEARQTFEDCLTVNRRLGLTRNYGPLTRSIAYNAYMDAGEHTGSDHDHLLDEAAAAFQDARKLVLEHGVPEEQRSGSGLITINLTTSLDEATASRASGGFSAAQEVRICESFLARIALEKGNLAESAAFYAPQLAAIGPDVPRRDVYESSVLLHRGGLIDNAMAQPAKAFARFARSVKLAVEAGSRPGVLINLMDMAHCLSLLPVSEQRAALAELRRMTRKAAPLMARAFPMEEAECRNTLAATYLGIAPAGQSLESAAMRTVLLAEAGENLTRAASRLDGIAPQQRNTLSLRAAVILNRARLAQLTGADATPFFKEALGIAEKGLLSGMRWRALAGLGRLHAAFDVLQSVPLSELRCGRGEIVNTFAPLVAGLVSRDRSEDAFNMAEQLLELERINRMGPMFFMRPPASEEAVLMRAAPRLMRIRALVKEAEGNDTERIRQLIDQEAEILERALGPDAAKLPGMALLARGSRERSWLTILTGLDATLKQAAEQAVKDANNLALARYEAARDSYEDAVKQALSSLPLERPAEALGLFLPRPADYFDVSMAVPDGREFVMFFPDGNGGVIRFDASGEFPKATRIDRIPGNIPSTSIVACPDVDWLPLDQVSALSATQLVRAAWSLKPFRTRLLRVGGKTPSGYLPVEDGRMETAQTLAVDVPAKVLDPAPARPGERGRAEPVLIADGVRISGVTLARDGASLSSAVLADLADGDIYAFSHLMTVYGIPSLYNGEVDGYLRDLLEGSPETAAKDGRLLGHPGLTPQEATSLARTRFREFVMDGQAVYRDGDYMTAQINFANAVAVIDETPDLAGYLPDALAFARESAYRAGHYEDAAEFASRLVELTESRSPDSQAHADALLKYGLVEAAAGHYGDAIPALRKATGLLASSGGMEAEASALAELGVVLENSLNYSSALGVFDEAAEVADQVGNDTLLARQHANMGRVLDLRLDEYVNAKQEYAKALEINRLMGDSRAAAQNLLDMGRCDRLLGNLQQAGDQYEKALGMAKGDTGLVARIRLEQANNAWFAAQYQDAFTLNGQVLETARSEDDTLLEALGMNTSGLLWWTLGDTDRALRDLDEALRLAHTVAGREDVVASILNNQGLVLRESDRYDEALAKLNEALSMDRASGSRWGQAYALRNIARTRLEQGDADAALPLLKEALALTRETGNRINEAKVLVVMGRVQFSLGRMDQARDIFEQALAASDAVGLPEVRWRALHGLGRVAQENGDLSVAEADFRQAVDLIETLRAGVRMQELRDGFAVGRQQPYEDLVRVLADMDRPADAFAVAERSRARNLVEMLGNGARHMRNELGTELYNGLLQLRNRIREQQALLKRAELDEEKAVYSRNLAGLNDRYRDLLLRARAENPDLAGIIEAEPLDLSSVQALLEPHVSLLVYYLLDDEILCWSVSDDSFALSRTPVDREEMAGLILDFRRGLQNLEPVDATSNRLYELLLGGVDIPEGTLGIVPHGVLHHLSFAVLDNGERYLVDDHPLFRVPSASVMAHTFARRGTASGEVLVAADPDVGSRAMELPFARKEGRAVAFNFPDVRLLLGNKAIKSAIVEDMAHSRIIHIAAHGEFDRENPLMSTVKLAPGPDGDGDLDASEIFGISAPADLVVLSACQTGLSRVSDGDDVFGLNRAFLFAGTHVLGASLWRVSDVASAILMKDFYRNLSGATKSAALRKAMLHVRRQYPHPGYWGAFTLTGDYQ